MLDLIDIVWVGHRKSGSSRGSIYGWFVMAGESRNPNPYPFHDGEENSCYIINGHIGQTLHINRADLTMEFFSIIEAKKKNFKEIDPNKLLNKWGKNFTDDLGMFLTIARLSR